MLEGYTIGLPEEGLDADGLTDPSQHVPLLNCVANQVLGYYGNCMVMPFSIPASLAVRLAEEPNADGVVDEAAAIREPLTNSAVQEALTRFHKEAFSPPVSRFSLPTRGVIGEAVLGHCPSAEKIDLTRFWNWQDSPADEATAIANAGLRANTLAQLAAPATLSNVPTIVNNVAGEGGGGAAIGSLVNALAGKAPAQADFSTDFLGKARPEAPATEPIRLVAREIDGGTSVPEASWVALRASSSTVVEDAPATRRYAKVAPPMQAAGWIHPTPLAAPGSLGARGTLVRFVNLTGLVAGETTLGAELALLHAPAAIARSALAPFSGWVWNGSALAAPA